MNGDIKKTYYAIVFRPDGELVTLKSDQNLLIEVDHEDCGWIQVTDKKTGMITSYTGMPFMLTKKVDKEDQ